MNPSSSNYFNHEHEHKRKNNKSYQWRIQDLTLRAWTLSTGGCRKLLKALEVEVKGILACFGHISVITPNMQEDM